MWQGGLGSGISVPMVTTPKPSPTQYGPVSHCVGFMSPAVVTWAPAPSDIPAIGTSYIVVDPNVNTTSTSVACNQTVYEQYKTRFLDGFGNFYGGTMNEQCTFMAPYQAPEYRDAMISMATYPGPSALFEVGYQIQFEYWGPSYDGRWTWETLIAPHGPRYYTGEIITSTGLSGPGIPWNTMWALPGLSKMFPDLPDLTSCTLIHFRTTPNSLTFARFLTEAKTLPRTAAGSLTVPPSESVTPVPAPKPTLVQPLPSQAVGHTTPVLEPAGPLLPSPPTSVQEPAVPQPPADAPPSHAPAPGSGHGNVPSGQVQPAFTPSALILPDQQTVSAGAAPVTILGRLVFLDNKGTVHIAPTPVPGSIGSVPAQATAISLEQISHEGGIRASDIWIPAQATSTVQSNNADVSNPSTGTSKGDETIGESIGRTIGSIGSWIASGLGASTGRATTQNTTSTSGSKGTGVVSFTGDARRQRSLGSGLVTMALCVVFACVL
ncbi:Hypothetical protein D9617_5g068610 [Elsinoe fawcettii]|nr:Hypothetical protein D9617_5g068610 [Elsinoe fawcettii]